MNRKRECHVTDIGYVNPINIRWKVCSSLPAEFENNGKFYCALHLPLDSKVDDTNYNKILKERLENEQYDLRGVYFPSPFFFKEGKHKKPVDFSAAIFSQGGYFRLSIFEDDATFIGTQFFYGDFSSSLFKKYCSFKGAVFNAVTVDTLIGENIEFQGAHLPSTRFEGHTDFSEAKFFSNANFQSSTFLSNSYFIKTKFFNVANFKQNTFGRDSRLHFRLTEFHGIAGFSFSSIEGTLDFHGNQTNIVFNNENTRLDFQHCKIAKPEALSFHTTRLRPSWLANIDARKMIFVDVYWKDKKNYKTSQFVAKELQSLIEIGIENPKKIFIISCRQLAENAENNNRFEESSNFRRMAFETEWLEKREKISNWINDLVPENEKLKRRFGGSEREEDKPNPPTNSFGILRRSGDFIIHWLYRITSFYGESWSRAAIVLLTSILVVFPFIYTLIEFQVTPKNIPLQVVVKDCKDVDEELKPVCKIENRGLNFWSEAIPHSLATATLQTVEYRIPKTPWGSIWIILEKIFAPLQAALLALAIRRKFMR